MLLLPASDQPADRLGSGFFLCFSRNTIWRATGCMLGPQQYWTTCRSEFSSRNSAAPARGGTRTRLCATITRCMCMLVTNDMRFAFEICYSRLLRLLCNIVGAQTTLDSSTCLPML